MPCGRDQTRCTGQCQAVVAPSGGMVVNDTMRVQGPEGRELPVLIELDRSNLHARHMRNALKDCKPSAACPEVFKPSQTLQIRSLLRLAAQAPTRSTMALRGPLGHYPD